MTMAEFYRTSRGEIVSTPEIAAVTKVASEAWPRTYYVGAILRHSGFGLVLADDMSEADAVAFIERFTKDYLNG